MWDFPYNVALQPSQKRASDIALPLTVYVTSGKSPKLSKPQLKTKTKDQGLTKIKSEVLSIY